MPPESAPTIYRAVYSNVPVLEMMVHGVAVMRRTKDSYLNATQILKVAGFDKSKRTKILEREVLIGEHTKVQGGYGKYQGTWIPEESGRELAERYNVLDSILPILELDMSMIGVDGENCQLPLKDRGHSTTRYQQSQEPSHSVSSSQTPPPASPIFSISSPISSSPAYGAPSPSTLSTIQSSSQQSLLTRPARDDKPYPHKKPRMLPLTDENSSSQATDCERQRSVLMSIFLSDDSLQVSQLFDDLSRPSDLNIDLVIDDHGHTALHWAASLARLKTLEMLLSQGADVCRGNYAGETALMRSVATTHNYDKNCFSQVLNALSSSIETKDNRQRTVFHHIVLSAAVEGQKAAAAYYMEHILSLMSVHGHSPAILNSKDDHGDTPLAIAKRLDDKLLIDLLVHHSKGGVGQTKPGPHKTNLPKQQRGNALTPSARKGSRGPSEMAFVAPGRPGGPNKRSNEIVSAVQTMLQAMEEEYALSLREQESELERTRRYAQALATELEEARKMLKEQQAEAEQLAEARLTIRKLESALVAQDGKFKQQQQADNFRDEGHTMDPQATSQSSRESQLEQRIQHLQVQLDAYRGHHEEMENRQAEAMEKEFHCKRLIAACCNIPVEKVDEFIEPLMDMIQCDPLDLDIDRVIGFMENVRRQKEADSQTVSMTDLSDASSENMH